MASLTEYATYTLKHTAIVPALLAYTIGSRHSLRAYLAAQQLGPAPELSEELKKKLSWRRNLLGLILVFGIFGSEIYLISTQNEKALAMCCRYLFAAAFQRSIYLGFADLTKAYEVAVHRAPSLLVFRRVVGTASWSRVVVCAAIATALNAAAFFELHYAAGLAISAAVLYRFLAYGHTRTFSIRIYTICLLSWLALTFILSGVMVMLIANYYMDGAAGDGTVATGEAYDGPTGALLLNGYTGMWMSAWFALAPGLLIAACYRFDYANHVESSPEVASIGQLATTPAPRKFTALLSEGVIVPQTDPVGFARPYYTTALWSWLLAALASFGIISTAMPLDEDMMLMRPTDYLTLTLSIPFMVVGLVVTASIRGEFKRVWTYKEVWVPKQDDDKTEGAIALPEGDDEEALPAYEVDEERDSVDEKAPLVVVDSKVDNSK
ncbi:hypothetical protein C6P46_005197 [Rhodotorula mucilaginosa]|uniref:Uncharacterized protein n=1 Tax=Rhodotorula mucilaginosa TaxID=5537 RepID=A0A9P7B5A1_RHOMI|nr:hypothetical protein C6P46_005197 [Rhodotorula mucilaginosa]